MVTQTIRIMGIDPGLRRTGWGIVELDGNRLGHIANGTIAVVDNHPLASRLLALHDALTAIVEDWAPQEVAVEETFVNKDARATLKLGHARAMALVVPAAAGLSVAEYAPNAVKKAVVGNGHADKGQIHQMVRILLPQCTPHSADAADALAVAITHAHSRGHAGGRLFARTTIP